MRAQVGLVLGALAGAAGLFIAGRPYRQTRVVAGRGASGRLVAAPGRLLYCRFWVGRLWMLAAGTLEPQPAAGLPDADVHDILSLSATAVLVATSQGLFEYNFRDGRVRTVTNVTVYSLASNFDNAVFAVDGSMSLHAVKEGALQPVAELRARHVAFSRAGHVYHTTALDSPVYRRTGGPGGTPVAVEGITLGFITLLETNKKEDVVYICHSEGLYFVRPDSDEVQWAGSFTPDLLGLGFSLSGDIYVGRVYEILKMTALTRT